MESIMIVTKPVDGIFYTLTSPCAKSSVDILSRDEIISCPIRILLMCGHIADMLYRHLKPFSHQIRQQFSPVTARLDVQHRSSRRDISFTLLLTAFILNRIHFAQCTAFLFNNKHNSPYYFQMKNNHIFFVCVCVGGGPNKIRAERSEQEVAAQAFESSRRILLSIENRVRNDSSPDNSHTATSRCLRQHRIAFGATPGNLKWHALHSDTVGLPDSDKSTPMRPPVALMARHQ